MTLINMTRESFLFSLTIWANFFLFFKFLIVEIDYLNEFSLLKRTQLVEWLIKRSLND